MPDKSPEVQARACEQAAILKSLENLMSYPWVRKRVSEDKLALHGWYFDMKIGALMQYDSSAGEFRVIDLNLDHPAVPLQASQMFENWEYSPP